MPRDLSPEELASRYGSGAFYNDSPEAGLGTRFGASIDRAQAGLIGIGEAAGLDWGDWRRENEAQQEQSMQRYFRDNPNDPRSMSGINGVGSALRYARGLAIDSAPELLTAAATGGAGAFAGLGTAARLGLAAAANYPAALGDVLQNQREEAGRTDMATAAAYAIPYAAADMIGLEGALARGRLLRTGLKSLDEMQGVRGAAARTGANAGLNFVAEGGGETFQEVMNQGARIAVNPSQTLFNEDANQRYLESFVGGGLLGGMSSAALGGWMRSPEYAPAQPQDPSMYDTNWQDYQSPAGMRTPTGPMPMRSVDQGGFDMTRPDVNVDVPAYLRKQAAEQAAAQAAADASVNQTSAPPTAPDPAVVEQWFTEREMGSLAKSKRAVEVYQQVAAAGLEEDDLTSVYQLMAERKFKKAETELGKIVTAKQAEAAKTEGAANGNTSAAAPVVAGPSAGGSPVAQGRVAAPGSNPVVGAGGSGAAVVAGTPGAEAGTVAGETNKQPAVVGPARRVQAPSPIAPAAPTVDNTQGFNMLTPRPTLKLTKPAQENFDPTEDQLEIAKLTGQDKSVWSGKEGGGLVSAIEGELAGTRMDTPQLGDEEAQAILAKHFEGSEDPQRDGQILQAYLTALNGAHGTKTEVAQGIADQFGVTPGRVRQVGNTEKLVETGLAMGYSPEQIRGLFEFSDNSKVETDQAVAELRREYRELDKKRKGTNGVAPQKLTEQETARMAELAGELARREQTNEGGSRSVSSALKDLGVELEEGDNDTGFTNLDSDRFWAKETGDDAATARVATLYEREQNLQRMADIYEEQGLDDAVERVRSLIARNEEKLIEALAKAETIMKAKAKRTSAAVEKTAKKEAKGKKAKVEPIVEEDVYKTPSEMAADAWNAVADEYQEIPRWESLPREDQDTFIEYGEDNWGTQDVLGMAVSSTGQKFGKVSQATVENPYTASELEAELKKFMRVDSLGRRIFVVDKPQDLPAYMAAEIAVALKETDAFGWTKSGKAVLIASRIQKGQGRAKFMHEVGGHLGTEGLLPAKLLTNLVNQLQTWRDANDGSLESDLAKKAWARVEAANTPTNQQQSELIAYFLEEAMQAGVDPLASAKDGGPLANWFRSLWAAFKVALRKLGLKPESMTAQDVVNMAYGAARLEVSGTWHGTAAQFRKFNHKYIGKGEGAQVFGWGTYLAQRFGVAQGYWKDDVRRKTVKGGEVSFGNGKPLRLTGYDMRSFLANAEILSSTFANSAVLAPDWKTKLGAVEKEAGDVLKKRDEFAPKLEALEAEYERLKANFEEHKASPDYTSATSYTKEMAVLTARGALLQAQISMPGEFAIEQAEKKLAMAKEVRALGGFKRQTASAPEGMLMRVDTALTPQDTIDYDKPLSKQNESVKEIMQGILEPINDEIVERKNLDWDELTGEDLFGKSNRSLGLLGMLISDDVIQDWDSNPATRKAVQAGDLHKAASLYLLSKGIRGIEFYDGDSRGVGRLTEKGLDRARQELQDAQDDLAMGSASQDDVDAAQAKFAEADAAHRKNGKNFVVFDERDIFRVGGQVGAEKDQMKFGKNLAVPKAVQPQVQDLTKSLKTKGSQALNGVMFSEDLFNRAASMGIPAAKEMGRIYQQRAALTGRIERDVIRIEQMFNRMPQNAKGTGPMSANKFLYDSTREGKWGFRPDWKQGASKLKLDSAMVARFNALPASAQEWVKAVFKHGDEMLTMKREALLKAASAEYDARMEEAKKDGDTAALKKLEAEKKSELARFSRLFAANEDAPYSPLRRFGDWVVVGKSKEYQAAEKAGDTKRMSELESDDGHYHVSFAESYASALELQRQIKDAGLEVGEPRQKEQARNDMYGGLMSAFDKLRGNIDSEMANASGDERAALRKAREVVTDLYLQALAENSARKSEMRRRGVAGEIDMLRSFSTQGRADAHFLAAATFNPQMTQTVVKMRQQKSTAGNETEKSMAFNEVMKRHEQSMKYEDGGWYDVASRASAVTSAWVLATSPTYYLQNLTQPAVISVPYMTGRHKYDQVWGQLLRAYYQMGPMLKSAKVGEGFDFSTVPDDVRPAILELVNRGRIDIGMDTELGKVKLEGDNVASKAANRVSQFFRTVGQKVEAINRVSTAMTAYRLERKNGSSHEEAMEYADEVLSKTHGDYTRVNAPRLFNTPFGKVALQFRKFQLIQLTLLFKLFHDSFQGASPEERAAARKMLAFTLGHTGVLAGVVGMPGFAAVSFILGKLLSGDDGEPFDLENELRKLLGGGELARVVMRGAPMLAGVDISGKVGMGTALSILPYSDIEFTRKGFYEVATGLTLGATGGLGARVWEAFGDILGGDYYRGLAGLMPKGLSDAMRAFDAFNNGVTRKNGDTLVSADEVSVVDAFAKAIGLTTAKESERKFDQGVAYETKKAFDESTTRIKNAYVKARREGDSAAAAQAVERWNKLQANKKEAGFAPQPMSTLLKAPQQQAKRDQMKSGGVAYTKQNRQFVINQTGD